MSGEGENVAWQDDVALPAAQQKASHQLKQVTLTLHLSAIL